ncbi:hypothetical protein CI610_00476 [invertebrate metagenome]|uniref:Polysaccharide biosynthesis protein C-terminal domain-containing protein n=1 Tax=invertebrate metagenome TaxID=1711999 RepID=A0A2H9TBL0_9ZZZZ
MNLNIIINVGLRSSTLVSKFALLFFLAKFSTPETVGLYGLVTVTVGYLLYLLGLDFYTYTTREMLSTDNSNWPEIIKNQVGFFTVTYLLFLPCIYFLFFLDILPKNIVLLFYGVLILEHITQELNRLLIAMGKVLTASWVLFFRSGLWCYIAVGLISFKVFKNDLVVVLTSWILGGAIATIIGLIILSKYDWRSVNWLRMDWKWIRKGLSVAGLFLLGTLCLRGIYTADRYIIQSLSGLAAVGVYTFYAGVSNAFSTFIDAVIISFRYPKIVQAYRSNNIALFLEYKQKMLKSIILTSLIIGGSAILLIQSILDIIGNATYIDKLYIFGYLLAAASVTCISYVPHYALYAMGKDKYLAAINIGGVLIFLIFVQIQIRYFESITSVSFSILLVSLYFLVAKQTLCFTLTRKFN